MPLKPKQTFILLKFFCWFAELMWAGFYQRHSSACSMLLFIWPAWFGYFGPYWFVGIMTYCLFLLTSDNQCSVTYLDRLAKYVNHMAVSYVGSQKCGKKASSLRFLMMSKLAIYIREVTLNCGFMMLGQPERDTIAALSRWWIVTKQINRALLTLFFFCLVLDQSCCCEVSVSIKPKCTVWGGFMKYGVYLYDFLIDHV